MQKRAKTTDLIEMLRKTTFGQIYGEMTDYSGIRPSLTKNEFIQRRRCGFYLPKLSNVKFERHFSGKDSFYFFGNPNSSAPYTLAIIDIDVMKSKGKGSPEGAIAFAQHLKETWPGLCWEKSASGKGLGCPIFIRKDGRTAIEVNAMLRKLDRWLKAEASRIGADIENVEIKGTLPIITYRNGSPEAIKFGQFARFPRSIKYADLSNAPVLSCEEWLLKEFVEQKAAKIKMSSGSTYRQVISDDELAAIPKYERLCQRLVGETDLKANARFTVTSHDFAIACVLLKFFKQNPNKDGSMPMRRAKMIWNSLFHDGKVLRPFNDRRWSRIRNWLSEKGHIDWVDERYQAPNPNTGFKGIACKWSITDEFCSVLNNIDKRERVFVDTIVLKRGNGKWLSPRLFPIQLEIEAFFYKCLFTPEPDLGCLKSGQLRTGILRTREKLKQGRYSNERVSIKRGSS